MIFWYSHLCANYNNPFNSTKYTNYTLGDSLKTTEATKDIRQDIRRLEYTKESKYLTYKLSTIHSNI